MAVKMDVKQRALEYAATRANSAEDFDRLYQSVIPMTSYFPRVDNPCIWAYPFIQYYY